MNDAEAVGDVVTGAILAREVERVGSARPPHPPGICLNCAAPLAGPYCSACGQAAHVHRTLASLGHDFLHGVFHFEGKLWETLPLLARRPGELTRRYVAGERAKFVSPMALFLFSVFLLFAAIHRLDLPDIAGAAPALISAKQELVHKQEGLDERIKALRQQRASADGGEARKLDDEIETAMRQANALRRAAAQVPSRPIGSLGSSVIDGGGAPLNTGWDWFDRQAAHVQQNPALYAYKLQSASYKFSWALIPISIPFIWSMFFWRRDVGLYDHAIFAIYSLAFMTLLVVGLIGLALLGVAEEWLWLTMLIVPPIHMFKQLRGAYRLGRLGAAWRTIALLIATSVCGILFVALLVWLEAE